MVHLCLSVIAVLHEANDIFAFCTGSSEETVFPDPDIRLFPMHGDLTDNEVLLCRELLNLHDELRLQPEDKAGKRAAKGRVDEQEDSHHVVSASEHCTPMSSSTEGTGPSRESSDNDISCCGTVFGMTEDIRTSKPPAEDAAVKYIIEPMQQVLPEPKVSLSDGATATPTTTPTMTMQGDQAHVAPDNVLPQAALNNFPAAPPFQNAVACPLFALPQKQQHMLLSAARLLSSVNPGLAVAAISQARQFDNLLDISCLGKRGGCPGTTLAPHHPPSTSNDFGLPTATTSSHAALSNHHHLQYPSMSPSDPKMFETNNSRGWDLLAARMLLRTPPGTPSKAEHH